jgi:hypothetical protein
LRLEIERKQICALHSCIENLEKFCAFKLNLRGIDVSLGGEDGIALKSAMDFDMTTFHPLSVGRDKLQFK